MLTMRDMVILLKMYWVLKLRGLTCPELILNIPALSQVNNQTQTEEDNRDCEAGGVERADTFPARVARQVKMTEEHFKLPITILSFRRRTSRTFH